MIDVHRRGSDPELLWLWHRLAVAALTGPLGWELPQTTGSALKNKNKNKNISTHMFTAALFTIAKIQKLRLLLYFIEIYLYKCPLRDEQIKKMWYIYTMDYYSTIKNNEIIPSAATWMQLEIIILNEVSQKRKGKYHMIALICGV